MNTKDFLRLVQRRERHVCRSRARWNRDRAAQRNKIQTGNRRAADGVTDDQRLGQIAVAFDGERAGF